MWPTQLEVCMSWSHQFASEAFSSHPKLTAFGSGKLCYKLYNFQSFGHTKRTTAVFAIHFDCTRKLGNPDGPSAAVSWCWPCRLPETCLNSFEKSIWRLTWRKLMFLCLLFCTWRFLPRTGLRTALLFGCSIISACPVKLAQGIAPRAPSWFFWKWVE